MRRRILIVGLVLLTLCLGAALGGGAWVLRTEPGARWAAAQAVAATDGALSLEGAQGTLGGGMRIARLAYGGDGWAVSADGVRFDAHVSAWPPGVRIENLRIAAAEVTTAESSSPPADEVGLEALPLTVAIPNAEIGPLRVDGEPAWRSAAGSVDLGDALRLTGVRADTAVGPAELDALLGFEAPWPIRLELAAGLVTAAGADPIPVSVQADGDAERLGVEARAESLEITVAGALQRPLTGPRAQLTATAPRLAWPPGDAAPPVVATDVSIGFEGWLAQFEWTIEGELDAWGFENASVQAAGTGRPAGLEAEQLSLRDAKHDLAGSGSVEWGETPTVAVNLEVRDLAIDAWLDGWEGERHRGSAALRWDAGGLTLSGAVLEGRHSDMRLSADGHWDAESGEVEATLDWCALAWPADGADARLTSAEGSGRVTGTVDAWSANASGDLSVADFPRGRVEANAAGDRDGAELSRLAIDALGGRARGEGRVGWGEDGAWSARLSLTGIDAAPLWAELSGPLDGDLALAGDWRSGAFSAGTDGLTGAVRGRPVAVRGSVALVDEAWRFDDLHAESGDTVVNIDGAPWGDGVTVRARSVVAEHWTELASGTLDAEFRATLNPARPAFEGEVLARDVVSAGLAAERVALVGSWRPGVDGASDIDLNVAGLRDGDNEFGLLRGRYAGAGTERELSVEVTGETAAFRLRATGAFERAAAGDWRWRGALQQASLDASWPDFDGFDLRAPARILAGARLLELDEACLAADGDGSICVAASGVPAGRLAATVALDSWPMDSVSSVLALGVRPSQALTGRATLTLDALDLVATEGALDISPGRVRRADIAARPLRTEAGRVDWSMAPDRALELTLDLPLVDVGTARGEFRVEQPLGSEGVLSGALNLALEDLAPVAGPFPAIDEAGGRLDAQLDFGGTLGDPQLAGSVDLSDGLIEFQPLGLRITDIELGGRFAAGEPAELSGRFRSGEGTGRLEARLSAAPDDAVPHLKLRLTGQDIALADLPDVRVVATPDLEFAVRGQRMELGGTLHIPFARLTPREDPSEVVMESEDVVIVGAEAPAEDTRPTPVRLTGEVRVTLGDDVRLSLASADMRIDGEVGLRWDGREVIPTADGQFAVRGQYRAYGQLLQVSEGKVAFPGVPADDPNLDIRAEREIFGSREVDAAGVWITGTAQRPDLLLYTEPPTSDEQALSFLVTGSDFDYADGVGQLTVGTYVLPRLFVSYGRGLFEDINVISGRFDISEHWGIKGSSSERESGVDLTYTIDK